MATVPPAADHPLLVWSQNADAKITATPTVYGLTAGDATALHALVLDYDARLATATNPATRTKVTVAAKNTSKIALRDKVRQLLKIVSAFPSLTPSQRAELGMNPKDAGPTPIPVPATRPLLTIAPDGSVQAVDESMPDRRAKPAGTNGLVAFMKIGLATDEPPTAPDQAKFAALATRSRFTLPIPPGSNGKTLWVLAQWYNERGELGPVSAVVSTTIAA